MPNAKTAASSRPEDNSQESSATNASHDNAATGNLNGMTTISRTATANNATTPVTGNRKPTAATRARANSRHSSSSGLKAALRVLPAILTLMVCLGACAPKHSSYSTFKTIPAEGWNKTLVLEFTPAFADSAKLYDVSLAIRHTNNYEFSNLNLVVDIIGNNGNITRKTVDFKVADNYGNWLGSGFGALYQCSNVIATGVSPDQMKSIVVWQAMGSHKVVHNVADVGVTVSPSEGN